MSSTVLFKLKSSLDYDTIAFEGMGISVVELKRAIVEKKMNSGSKDFDLVIADAQTGVVFNDDSAMVQKDTSLTVERVPMSKRAAQAKQYSRGGSAAARGSGRPQRRPSIDAPASSASATSAPEISTDLFEGILSSVAATKPIYAPPSSPDGAASPANNSNNNNDNNVVEDADDDEEKMLELEMQEQDQKLKSMSKQRVFSNQSYVAATGPTKGNKGADLWGAFSNPTSSTSAGADKGTRTTKTGSDDNDVIDSMGMMRKQRRHGRHGIPSTLKAIAGTTIDESIESTQGDSSSTGNTISNNSTTTTTTTVEGGGGGTAEGTNSGSSSWAMLADTQGFMNHVKDKGVGLTEDQLRHVVQPTDVPKELQSALSGILLKEAVRTPCCSLACTFSEIHGALIASGCVCPLCRKEGITVERLVPDKDLRMRVSEFLTQFRKQYENEQRSKAKEEHSRSLALDFVAPSNNRPDRYIQIGSKSVTTTTSSDPTLTTDTSETSNNDTTSDSVVTDEQSDSTKEPQNNIVKTEIENTATDTAALHQQPMQGSGPPRPPMPHPTAIWQPHAPAHPGAPQGSWRPPHQFVGSGVRGPPQPNGPNNNWGRGPMMMRGPMPMQMPRGGWGPRGPPPPGYGMGPPRMPIQMPPGGWGPRGPPPGMGGMQWGVGPGGALPPHGFGPPRGGPGMTMGPPSGRGMPSPNWNNTGRGPMGGGGQQAGPRGPADKGKDKKGGGGGGGKVRGRSAEAGRQNQKKKQNANVNVKERSNKRSQSPPKGGKGAIGKSGRQQQQQQKQQRGKVGRTTGVVPGNNKNIKRQARSRSRSIGKSSNVPQTTRRNKDINSIANVNVNGGASARDRRGNASNNNNNNSGSSKARVSRSGGRGGRERSSRDRSTRERDRSSQDRSSRNRSRSSRDRGHKHSSRDRENGRKDNNNNEKSNKIQQGEKRQKNKEEEVQQNDDDVVMGGIKSHDNDDELDNDDDEETAPRRGGKSARRNIEPVSKPSSSREKNERKDDRTEGSLKRKDSTSRNQSKRTVGRSRSPGRGGHTSSNSRHHESSRHQSSSSGGKNAHARTHSRTHSPSRTRSSRDNSRSRQTTRARSRDNARDGGRGSGSSRDAAGGGRTSKGSSIEYSRSNIKNINNGSIKEKKRGRSSDSGGVTKSRGRADSDQQAIALDKNTNTNKSKRGKGGARSKSPLKHPLKKREIKKESSSSVRPKKRSVSPNVGHVKKKSRVDVDEESNKNKKSKSKSSGLSRKNSEDGGVSDTAGPERIVTLSSGKVLGPRADEESGGDGKRSKRRRRGGGGDGGGGGKSSRRKGRR